MAYNIRKKTFREKKSIEKRNCSHQYNSVPQFLGKVSNKAFLSFFFVFHHFQYHYNLVVLIFDHRRGWSGNGLKKVKGPYIVGWEQNWVELILN
jgi:hypothetical protein